MTMWCGHTLSARAGTQTASASALMRLKSSLTLPNAGQTGESQIYTLASSWLRLTAGCFWGYSSTRFNIMNQRTEGMLIDTRRRVGALCRFQARETRRPNQFVEVLNTFT